MSLYISLIEADAYFDEKLRAKSWLVSTNSDKEKALLEATRIINNLNFNGLKVEDNQELEFPRKYTIINLDGTIEEVVGDSIPVKIKFACAEIANSLLSGTDPDKEREKLHKESISYSGVRTAFNRETVPDYILAGVPSMIAWNLLLPFLSANTTLTLLKG